MRNQLFPRANIMEKYVSWWESWKLCGVVGGEARAKLCYLGVDSVKRKSEVKAQRYIPERTATRAFISYSNPSLSPIPPYKTPLLSFIKPQFLFSAEFIRKKRDELLQSAAASCWSSSSSR